MAACAAKTASGKPCRARALKGRQTCFFHSAETRAAWKAASAKGGSRRAVDVDAAPLSLTRAKRLLAGLVGALLEGSISPDAGRAAVAAVSAAFRISEAGELKDMAARLRRLEDFPSGGKRQWRIAGE